MRTISSWTVIVLHVNQVWLLDIQVAVQSAIFWRGLSQQCSHPQKIYYKTPAAKGCWFKSQQLHPSVGQLWKKSFTSEGDGGVFRCGKAGGSTFSWLFSTCKLFVVVSLDGRLCASLCWRESSQVSPGFCCTASVGDRQVQVMHDLVLTLWNENLEVTNQNTTCNATRAFEQIISSLLFF